MRLAACGAAAWTERASLFHHAPFHAVLAALGHTCCTPAAPPCPSSPAAPASVLLNTCLPPLPPLLPPQHPPGLGGPRAVPVVPAPHCVEPGCEPRGGGAAAAGQQEIKDSAAALTDHLRKVGGRAGGWADEHVAGWVAGSSTLHVRTCASAARAHSLSISPLCSPTARSQVAEKGMAPQHAQSVDDCLETLADLLRYLGHPAVRTVYAGANSTTTVRKSLQGMCSRASFGPAAALLQ